MMNGWPSLTFEFTGGARLYRAASGGMMGWVSVITGFDVVMVTLRDGELPHERRSALLLEREGALLSGVFKAIPFGCGLRPQP